MLQTDKLQKVKNRPGKTVARCPACAEAGGDRKGQHLIIYPNGKFGCITHPDDQKHNRRIWELASGAPPAPRIRSKKRQKRPPRIITQEVLRHLGTLGTGSFESRAYARGDITYDVPISTRTGIEASQASQTAEENPF